MQKIIDQTEKTARTYFGAFGFADEQISALIATGKKDLQSKLSELETLLDAPETTTEELNSVLHALKGLLFQLGNQELGEQINEIRSHLDDESALDDIRRILLS